jgi:hypothetical protein
MFDNVPTETPTETPNTQTQQLNKDVSAPHVAQDCLEIIEEYRKSERNGTAKAGATCGLVSALASTTPELTEQEFDDSLASYLSMLE